MNLEEFKYVFNDISTNLLYVHKGEHSSSHNKGIGNGRTKLTPDIVYYIKYTISNETYNVTKDLVFNKYNIIPTKDMVYKIRSNKTWKDI